LSLISSPTLGPLLPLHSSFPIDLPSGDERGIDVPWVGGGLGVVRAVVPRQDGEGNLGVLRGAVCAGVAVGSSSSISYCSLLAWRPAPEMATQEPGRRGMGWGRFWERGS
jgi:hypothetical protein